MIVCIRLARAVLFFFFSSRRRHTRLQGDWSSDVCSSDLKRNNHWVIVLNHTSLAPRVPQTVPASAPRSEEHTSELQSPCNLVCRLLLEKKNIRLPRSVALTTPRTRATPRATYVSRHA